MSTNNALNTNDVPLTAHSGGTGVANSSTITIAGNVAFVGPHTFQGTVTGDTTVTFPTSGTLATTAGASGIVNNGTANQIGYYATTGNAISGITGANGSVLVTNNTGVPSMLANPTATGRMLASVSGNAPAWSTSSYADTYAVSTILYASSSNTVTGLATTNRASLSTNSSGVPTWLALTDGQVVIGSTAGNPGAATISGVAPITVTPGSNTLSIGLSGNVISWSGISGTTQAATPNSAYVVQNASQTTITLPSTAALGSIVRVQGLGAGGWILTANTGQTIQVGQSATSSAGSVTSAAAYDAIEVVCIVANTTWSVSYVLSSGVTTS